MDARLDVERDTEAPLTMDYRISYAQNREDFLIAAFFPDVEAGHYVDVGAAHPTEYSVTKLFYDRGWRGINVEPIPELAALLSTERPKDVNLQVGLGAADGQAEFRQYAGSGLSTMSPAMIESHAAEDARETDEFVDIQIQVTTLAAVLREHPLPHIHFLKIDVEGSEYDVLRGNDWQQFRPELICIETDHMVRDWTPLLEAARYEQVFHDGLNAYYLAVESRDRADHFRYPKAALDAPVLVTPDVASELADLSRLRESVPALEAESAKLRVEVRSERAAHQDAQARAEAATEELRAVQAELRAAQAELQATESALQAEIERLTAALTTETSLRSAYAAREADLSARLTSVEGYLSEVVSSQSWRWTKPIRVFFEKVRALVPRRVVAAARARRQIQSSATEPTDLVSPDGAMMLDRLRALDDAGQPPVRDGR